MDNFLAAEVTTGCMDGPFTVAQAHAIFGGHFRTAPLGLVEKPGSTSLRLIRHLSKLDHLGGSTNGWIDLSVNATKYFSAADAADFVSFFFYIFCFFHTQTISYTFEQPVHNSHGGLSQFTFFTSCLCRGGSGSYSLRASLPSPRVGLDHVSSSCAAQGL